ncbi:MAG TPA: transposase [Bacteroidales bacterium]|nr:transposase [Bacteroidales bacterium]
MIERKPTRLHNYDYSSDNLYYVTSCVHKRECCFGEIITCNDERGISRKMILNEYGEIAQKQWYWLSKQYAFLILHEFVVMPNHIHGIIQIRKGMAQPRRDRSRPVPTKDVMKIKSLSELMGAYKTTVSKQIHLLESRRDRSRPVPTPFSWQRSFYEHIIRDEDDFERISKYILDNPSNWFIDEFNDH